MIQRFFFNSYLLFSDILLYIAFSFSFYYIYLDYYNIFVGWSFIQNDFNIWPRCIYFISSTDLITLSLAWYPEINAWYAQMQISFNSTSSSTYYSKKPYIFSANLIGYYTLNKPAPISLHFYYYILLDYISSINLIKPISLTITIQIDLPY